MPKQPKPLPPLSVLREMFAYDPETGAILNRISRTSRKAGTRADNACGSGYRQVHVAKSFHYAHRVAWALAYGEEPNGFIDHINGDRLDNRLCNLRVCSHVENMQNKCRYRHNTSGFKGVSYDARPKRGRPRWRAYITVDRRRVYLGSFRSKEEAAAAVAAARPQLHGEFARQA